MRVEKKCFIFLCVDVCQCVCVFVCVCVCLLVCVSASVYVMNVKEKNCVEHREKRNELCLLLQS